MLVEHTLKTVVQLNTHHVLAWNHYIPRVLQKLAGLVFYYVWCKQIMLKVARVLFVY